MTATATATTSPDEPITIQLQLQSSSTAASPPPSSSSATPSITLPRSSSVLQLKQSIQKQWARHPLPSGITCVLGGRVVRDSEVLNALFDQGEAQDPIEPKLFVIVKPDAWTVAEPIGTINHHQPGSSSSSSSAATSTPPPIPVMNTGSGGDTSPATNASLAGSSMPPAATTQATSTASTPTPITSQPLPPPPTRSGYNPTYIPSITTPSLVPSSSPYFPFLTHLNALPPLERTTFFLHLIQVHAFYTEDVELRSQRFQEYSAGSIERARVGRVLMGFGEDQKGQVEQLQNAFEMEGVAEMLKEIGLWSLVEKDMQRAQEEASLLGGGNYEVENGGDEGGFKMVTIDNKPYLLHQPAQAKTESPTTSEPTDHQARYLSLQRGRAILSILSTMIHLSLSALGASSTPLEVGVSAHHRPLIHQMLGLAPPPPQAGARAPLLGPHGALNALAPRRRGLTISIVLNLEVLVSLFVPLLILSTKLAFLLWIFARRASTTKRWVLVGLAGGWVLWEGWSMYKRRVAVVRARMAAANNGAGGVAAGGAAGGEAGADRERERDRERRRRRAAAAAAAAAAPPLAAEGGAPGAAGGPVGIPLDNQQQQPQDQLRRRAARQQPPQPQAQAAQPIPDPGRPRARAHRHGHGGRRPSSSTTSTSSLSPKYWITRIALIGLVDEALELGLAPRSIAGRPVQYAGNTFPVPGQQPHQQQPQFVQQPQAQQPRSTLRSRTLKTFLICVVLFFGTLIPEVERKRRKALEKRTRLLKERDEWIARMRAVAERAGTGMGTAAVGGAEASQAGTPTASQGAFGRVRADGQGSSTSIAGQEESAVVQGRRLVPDAQLFADGLGEPDQLRQYQQRQREISQAQTQASGSTQSVSASTSSNAPPSTSTSPNSDTATPPPTAGDLIDSGLNTGDNSALEDGDGYVDHELLTASDLERDLLEGDDGDEQEGGNEGDGEGDVDAMVGLF
ncbi:BZ3500_MvSof-1268-A1-R1_Chr2-2g04761 [Microbotryum saponariae]|uniref:BZ3500_MvSof-1268-A1-R1_Chr2-2g04761 protein n=1 Tax=Microbotryum saponariae TaxID=289078 RepID=A0A2X0L0Q5_9BASI|nr:BZ3500_MvSof-1268-A1-R1_Chr2-2g04761 [Microbotryum saponariae]SDA00101.1 BZ3501_MvSof-1269-A2-R1_Chr2-2g04435 [Microbotryum saponariae]